MPWNRLGQYSSTYMSALLSAVGNRYGFDLATPLKDFTPEQLGVLLYGLNGDVVHVKLRGNTTTEATFEGRHSRPEETLQRVGQRLHEGRNRKVHDRQDLPGL